MYKLDPHELLYLNISILPWPMKCACQGKRSEILHPCSPVHIPECKFNPNFLQNSDGPAGPMKEFHHFPQHQSLVLELRHKPCKLAERP